jgi:hypothetical protein
MHVEIIRNTLYKAYLEDFHGFCKDLGGVTAEVRPAVAVVVLRASIFPSSTMLVPIRVRVADAQYTILDLPSGHGSPAGR